jgi:hypothetical protein
VREALHSASSAEYYGSAEYHELTPESIIEMGAQVVI